MKILSRIAVNGIRSREILSKRARWLAMGTCLLALPSAVLRGQHDAPSPAVELGQRLFLGNCAGCHGPEGDAVPGADLGSGKFRRASTDEEVAAIIQKGIPGTAMPPHNFTGFAPGVNSAESQIGALIAYMRFMAASATTGPNVDGDAVQGKNLFEGKGNCLNCHRVKGRGSRLAPELSAIGSVRRPVELRNSILDPDAEILPPNRSFRVVTREGRAIEGRLLNQDTLSVQLIDASERLQSFRKSDLQEFGFVAKSPMPSYKQAFSADELANLVSYLSSLRGVKNP